MRLTLSSRLRACRFSGFRIPSLEAPRSAHITAHSPRVWALVATNPDLTDLCFSATSMAVSPSTSTVTQALEDMARDPRHPSLRSQLKRHIEPVADVLVQWLAADNLAGTRVATLLDAAATSAPSVSKLEKAASRAEKSAARAGAAHDAAVKKRVEAEEAIAELEKGKGKKAGGQLEALTEELQALEAAESETREAAEVARATHERAGASLAGARSVAEDAAQTANEAANESTLRAHHLRVTGRLLPCRIPRLLAAAERMVRERPEEVLLTPSDVTAILHSLSLDFERKGLNALFGKRASSGRPTGLVSFAEMRRASQPNATASVGWASPPMPACVFTDGQPAAPPCSSPSPEPDLAEQGAQPEPEAEQPSGGTDGPDTKGE